MFEFLKKAKEPEIVPQIKDPVLLEKKRTELVELIHKAASDGIITPIEDAEISQLAVQVGVNKTGIKKMINAEFASQLKAQIELFANDGEFDDNEMKAIKKRAKEIDVSDREIAMMIAEALSHHKEEVKKKVTAALTAFGIGVLAVGAVVGNVLMEVSSKGNLKITTVQHKKG